MEFRKRCFSIILFCIQPNRNRIALQFPEYYKTYVNQHDIFRLNVSVKDLLFMNVTNCIQKVPDDEGSGLLRKSLSVLDDIVKLSAFTQLQNRVKVVWPW